MVRTVIPTKTIETVEVGPFRANLRMWEHFPSETPTYTVEVWQGWNLKVCDEYLGHPRRRWYGIREQLAVMIARQAMGMETPTIKRVATIPNTVMKAIMERKSDEPTR